MNGPRHRSTCVLGFAVASVALAACGGSVTGTGSHADGDRPGGVADSQSTDVAGSGAGDESDPAAEQELIEDASMALAERYTVWLGETDHPVTYPETELETGPRRMLLILESTGGAHIGTVTFGTRPAPTVPTDPDEPYPPRLASWEDDLDDLGRLPLQGEIPDLYWLWSPYEGFEYSLVDTSVSASTLQLTFDTEEIFRESCPFRPEQADFCECRQDVITVEDPCVPGDRWNVELVASGAYLEGEIVDTVGVYRAARFRLQRIQ